MPPIVPLLRLTGKNAGLFYILPGAGSFSSALLSGLHSPGIGSGAGISELIGDIEKGVVRALVVLESDPFHYYPDRLRLDRAMSKLELLVAIDYFPTMTVNQASIFYPASTIFETGSTYINQEGRAQFAQRVHYGGVPIRGRRTPAAPLQGFCSRRRSSAGVEGSVGNRRDSSAGRRTERHLPERFHPG